MPSVLLVDDEAIFLSAMAKVLSRRGLTVHTAQSADQAFRAMDQLHPDAIVLDVRMPGLDGLSALAHIRKTWPSAPVILLTGHATTEMGQEAVRRGAFDFCTKPVRVSRLLKTIEDAMRSRRLTEAATQEDG